MRSRKLVTILTLLLVSLFAFASVASAAPSATAQEASEEAAEESAESLEDATAAPFDVVAAAKDHHFAKHIEALKARIHKLRAERKFIRENLSHKTTRYKVHRPKKTELIKELRSRIRELRADEQAG